MLGLWERPEAKILCQHFVFRSSIDWIRHHSQYYLHSRHLPARNFFDGGTDQPMQFA
ncbi:MAG: hypothetical protein KGS46_01765 [Chloroflexi bacterium]|nr:hypothetical protein [Chloroflexota bacterium]